MSALNGPSAKYEDDHESSKHIIVEVNMQQTLL